jgi:hypothetical protein
MKIRDITEAEVGTPNANAIAAKLKAAGYKKLGSGADATVWAKDEHSVIKILMPDETTSQAENIFLKFYEFCQSHQDVDCLPKFKEIGGAHHTTFVMGDAEYRQIAMERLVPIKRNTFEEAMVWILSDFADKKVQWEDVIPQLEAVDTWQNSAGVMKRMPQLIAQKKNDPEFNAVYGTLFTVMQVLYLTGKINKFGWDLHTENVMQRKNGTLVIIDPWFAMNEGT